LKIAILNLYTENIKEFAELSSAVNEKYAQIHNYDLKVCKVILDKSRPPAWSKIKLLQLWMLNSNYDWLWWIDSDAVITNLSIKLESIISLATDEFIIISKNPDIINSGSFLIKNSEKSKKFLSDVYNRKDCINHPWWEQQAMIKVLEREEYKNGAKYISQHSLNSMPDVWKKEDFIMHMPGKFKTLRLRNIKKFYKRNFNEKDK